jgi:hypothetical protein
MYFQNEPRISLIEGNNDFTRDRFEELLEIDLSDVGNTLVVMTWIGFPAWKTSCSIKELLSQEKLKVETIHAIKALIESTGQSYMCLEYVYREPEEREYMCPGHVKCSKYHKEDIERQVYLLREYVSNLGYPEYLFDNKKFQSKINFRIAEFSILHEEFANL